MSAAEYERLARDAEKAKPLRDWTEKWDSLTPVDELPPQALAVVEAFCESKRFTVAALAALGTRVAIRKGGAVWLAFAGTNGNGAVVALKYRPVGGSAHDSKAAWPSTWLYPIVVGDRASLDWLVSEGESDAARLHSLVGDAAAILVLPTGARAAFKAEWAAMIPRGATVYLAHDADDDGDGGAKLAARVIGGRTVRIRPPDGAKDWCEWPGDRDGFIALVDQARRGAETAITFTTLREFLALPFPEAKALVGTTRGGTNLGPQYGWILVWGAEGSSKTSVVVDLMAHAAEGREWAAYEVARPVRFVAVVNEGVPGGLQDKWAQKVECWDGDRDALLDGIAVYSSPWGGFTLRDERMLAHLRDFAHDFEADFIVLDPLHTVGTTGAGAPAETEEFKHLLRGVGLWESMGFITPHHSNKAGMVSGDWGRHPDTVVRLQKDGKRPATKWTLQKARPADPMELAVVQILDWQTETISYSRCPLGSIGVGERNRQAVLAAARPGCTADDLASQLGVTTKTVIRHLKALEADDRVALGKGARGLTYVLRVESEDDE